MTKWALWESGLWWQLLRHLAWKSSPKNLRACQEAHRGSLFERPSGGLLEEFIWEPILGFKRKTHQGGLLYPIRFWGKFWHVSVYPSDYISSDSKKVKCRVCMNKFCDWIQSAKSQIIELATTDPGISGCKPEWGIKDSHLPNTLHIMCVCACKMPF